MTDKQLPPDWAISKAMQETEMLFRAAGLGNVYDGMLIRARELSPSSPTRRGVSIATSVTSP